MEAALHGAEGLFNLVTQARNGAVELSAQRMHGVATRAFVLDEVDDAQSLEVLAIGFAGVAFVCEQGHRLATSATRVSTISGSLLTSASLAGCT